MYLVSPLRTIAAYVRLGTLLDINVQSASVDLDSSTSLVFLLIIVLYIILIVRTYVCTVIGFSFYYRTIRDLICTYVRLYCH